jgi:agmatinase
MAAAAAPTLIGIPYDRGSSHLRGAAEAPARIREALRSPATNAWSETGVDTSEHLRDAGDVSVPPDGNPRPAIVDAVTEQLVQHRRPLVLGGDHSVTHPVLRAVRPHHPRLTVLQVDAHPDLYDEFEGDRHSHACPFARILEEDLADRLVQVGIRAATPPQRRQAERFGVDVVSMRDWADGTRPNLAGPVYVSIDVDAMDPAFAPGVSHREPGGLSVRAVLDLLHALDGPVVGGDVVEYNPTRDVDGRTAPVCAKLVTELAGRMAAEAPGASGHEAGDNGKSGSKM